MKVLYVEATCLPSGSVVSGMEAIESNCIVEDPESVTFIGGGRKAPRDMKPCQPDEDQVNRPIVTA